MFDTITLTILPYVAMGAFVLATLLRLKGLSKATLAERLDGSRARFWGPVPLHVGVLLLFFGHIVALLLPVLLVDLNVDPLRVFILETVGLAAGWLAVFGLLVQLVSRATCAELRARTSVADVLAEAGLLLALTTGICATVGVPNGIVWSGHVLTPYLISLLSFAPDLDTVGTLPLVAKLHLFAGWLALGLLDLGRLLHLLLGGFAWLIGPVRLAAWRGTVGAMLLLGVVGCEPNNAGYQPTQPIAYSHALHAGVLKIPCQYCHYGAERGKHAGIPPASVCMNCHTQVLKDKPEVMKIKAALDSGKPIEWVRVHRVPDHVYFNHSAHIVGGVKCQTCHGPVQAMGRVEQKAPLSMGWCLSCHRTGGKGILGEDNGLARVDSHLTDCVTCHH